jgi:hypothetical protein
MDAMIYAIAMVVGGLIGAILAQVWDQRANRRRLALLRHKYKRLQASFDQQALVIESVVAENKRLRAEEGEWEIVLRNGELKIRSNEGQYYEIRL